MTNEPDLLEVATGLYVSIGLFLRQLRRSPGFACTAILILALGIGACTAMFNAIKPILLDSLPILRQRAS